MCRKWKDSFRWTLCGCGSMNGVLKSGANIRAKIEEWLEYSRLLLVCMSENAFCWDWAQGEARHLCEGRLVLVPSGLAGFGRNFIPLRHDEACRAQTTRYSRPGP